MPSTTLPRTFPLSVVTSGAGTLASLPASELPPLPDVPLVPPEPPPLAPFVPALPPVPAVPAVVDGGGASSELHAPAAAISVPRLTVVQLRKHAVIDDIGGSKSDDGCQAWRANCNAERYSRGEHHATKPKD
jgi:hypothetical protein